MARPSKYTPERCQKILAGLREGLTRAAAAGNAGVSYDTLLNWIRRFSSFSAQVEEAERFAEAKFTEVIAKAAFGHEKRRIKRITKPDGSTEETVEISHIYDWRAALEWLKRRRRKDWGDNLHVDLDEEIARLMAELVGGEGRGPQLRT